MLGVSRSTLYRHVPELRTGNETDGETDGRGLPPDTRPAPDVTVYDQLLTHHHTRPAGSGDTTAHSAPHSASGVAVDAGKES
jgi:hypothetical protein